MTPLFTALHQTLEVTAVDDDNVRVTVTLPSDLLNDYYHLLKSLTGFVNAVNHQKYIARLNSRVDQTIESHWFTSEHHKQIVSEYDDYINQGLSRNDAIKLISADLRKTDHPWCSIDSVKYSLTKAGRPARIGRPRKQS